MWKRFTQACAETLWIKPWNPWICLRHSICNTKSRKINVELKKSCLSNVVTQYGDQLYTKKRCYNRWQSHCFIGKHCCALQPIGVLSKAERLLLFRRFIDDIIWITASERSNERNRHELATITSAFSYSGLEATYRQAYTTEQTSEAEFL